MILESLLYHRAGCHEPPRVNSRVSHHRSTPVLLKISRLLVARDAHSYGMVPAARGYGTPVGGAAVAHALSAGSTVMDGETGVKLALALIAAADVLVRNPVCRPRRVFNQT